MSSAVLESPKKKQSALKSEDWLSLISGFTIVLLAIVGIAFTGLKITPKTDLNKAIPTIGLYFLVALLASLPTLWLHQNNWKRHLVAFLTVFALAIGALFLSSIEAVKQIGLEYVIFALILGILVRNILPLPVWFLKISFSEYFVKIGLVLLGTAVIFGDILKAGGLGLAQALIVVLLVWYFAFYLGRWFGIEKEINLMIASSVSICGVSAAIATAGAIQGDSKKLSYVVSLVLIVAIPMLVFMPLAAKYLELPAAVAGAWLGGTIDTTGAVVASGELLGPEALKYSTVVKFSQNILLGIAALAISLYWSFTNNKDAEHKASPKLLWDRFPKFVLGFTAASLLYSFVLPSDTIAATKDYLKSLQTILFAIAFVSIGLETDFKGLLKTGNGKPALVFITAQAFNIIVTLIVSYLLFSNIKS